MILNKNNINHYYPINNAYHIKNNPIQSISLIIFKYYVFFKIIIINIKINKQISFLININKYKFI